MPRYKIILEYDGAPYVGWQIQGRGTSVQGVFEEALLGFCGERGETRVAGRTDAGVHASGQVVHVDLSRDWTEDTVRDALNAHLRAVPIAVLAATRVSEAFDARFSAIKRRYRYTILNRRPPAAIDRYTAWWVAKPLDIARMQDGANRILGHHDFTTFRSTHCQAKNPERTLDVLTISRQGEFVHVDAASRAFLHNQVRSMVGCLKLVGEGHWRPERMREALDARDRKACGLVAPAHGLCLTRVDYPPDAC